MNKKKNSFKKSNELLEHQKSLNICKYMFTIYKRSSIQRLNCKLRKQLIKTFQLNSIKCMHTLVKSGRIYETEEFRV